MAQILPLAGVQAEGTGQGEVLEAFLVEGMSCLAWGQEVVPAAHSLPAAWWEGEECWEVEHLQCRNLLVGGPGLRGVEQEVEDTDLQGEKQEIKN